MKHYYKGEMLEAELYIEMTGMDRERERKAERLEHHRERLWAREHEIGSPRPNDPNQCFVGVIG